MEKASDEKTYFKIRDALNSRYKPLLRIFFKDVISLPFVAPPRTEKAVKEPVK